MISAIRTGVITSKAVPPIVPPFGNVVLLVHFNGTDGSTTFTDSSSSPKTLTSDGATISTAQSKFNGSSGFFGSLASKKVSIPYHADLEFGTGDFTIEGWFYTVGSSSNTLFSIGRYDTGTMFRSDYFTFVNEFRVSLNASIPSSSWFHCAQVRNGSNVSVYINGVRVFSGTTSASHTGDLSYIGNSVHYGLEQWNGYIDEFRITKGIALYTENFDPPTEPFPDS